MTRARITRAHVKQSALYLSPKPRGEIARRIMRPSNWKTVCSLLCERGVSIDRRLQALILPAVLERPVPPHSVSRGQRVRENMVSTRSFREHCAKRRSYTIAIDHESVHAYEKKGPLKSTPSSCSLGSWNKWGQRSSKL
jgi:hypothetical protein